jgi:protein gp37
MYLSKYNFGDDSRIWNPWFGCTKLSEACDNCYIKPDKNGFRDLYRCFSHSDAKPGTFVTVSLKSDFFLKDADQLRPSAWLTIKNNPDLIFLIITKRVDRITKCLPDDWGEGYDNVIICATAENQKRADERIPILLNLPAKHKWVTCSPLLEPIDLTPYLKTGKIEHVEVTGERDCTKLARPTKYEWVEDICKQCTECNVRFSLLYLGHNFVMPDGTIMKEWAQWYRQEVADSLGLFHYKPITFKLSDSEITY